MPDDNQDTIQESGRNVAGAETTLDRIRQQRIQQGTRSPNKEQTQQVQTRPLGEDSTDQMGVQRTPRTQQGPPAKSDDDDKKQGPSPAEILRQKLFGSRKEGDANDQGKKDAQEPEPKDPVKEPDPEVDQKADAGPDDDGDEPKITLSDVTRIATDAATAAAQASVPAKVEDSAAKAAVPTIIEGNRKAERTYKILKEMGKKWPSEYSDLAKQFEEELTQKQDYKREWKKENRDKAFNWRDEEHEAFLASVEVAYDDDDYAEARDGLSQKPVDTDAAAKLTQIEQQLRQRDAREAAARESRDALKGLTEGFPIEGDVDLSTPSGRSKLADGTLRQQVAAEVAGELEKHVSAVVEIYSGATKFNPKDPVHQVLADIELALNSAVAKLPTAKQLKDGKQFLTTEQYAQIAKSNPSHLSRYWTIGQPEMIGAIKNEAVTLAQTLAKNKAKELIKLAKAQGIDLTEDAILSPPPGSANGNASASKAKRHASPSATSGPKVDSSPEKAPARSEAWSQTLVKQLFPR